MCLDPISATALAISSVQAVAQYSGQKSQANAQARAIQADRDAARMDAQREQQQAYEASAAEVNAYEAEARRRMATFDVIAGEAGGGGSLSRQRAAIGVQQGQDLATLQSNSRKTQQEIGFGDLAAGQRASSNMAAIRQPSLLEAGLTIAGAGIGQYTKTQERKNYAGRP